MTWKSDVHDLILEQANQPFAWGKTDCLCQVSAAVKIKSGKDYMRGFRGKYSSYEEAMAILEKKGFKQPVDAVAAKLEEFDNVHEAADGDIGVIEGVDGTLAFGVIMKDKVFIQTERGMGRVPRARILRAFKVPEWPQQLPPSSSAPPPEQSQPA